MAYLLDSNILIMPERLYPMDVYPTFWKGLEPILRMEHFLSIDKVKDEIDRGQDELTEWCKKLAGSNFYLSTMIPSVLEKYAILTNWANRSSHYLPRAISEFCDITRADAFLVAAASAYGHTIITLEKPKPQQTSKIQIPEACEVLGVKYCDLTTVLRQMGLRL